MQKRKPQEDFELVARTFHGMEELLSSELQKLGARDLQVLNRAVAFKGDFGFIYKANLNLRTALNILLPVKKGQVKTENDLYRLAYSIEWQDIFPVDKTFRIDAVVNSDFFSHSQYVGQKVKDAIADKFRAHFQKRPDVNKEKPDVAIHVHITGTTCTISLDSSGTPLYKRGYRRGTGEAPLNEILAAAMVMMSGWQPHMQLLDPMCGSGTIPIEAALIAANIPPGYFRETFAFRNWIDFDEDLFDLIFEKSVNKINDAAPVIKGSDKIPALIKKAMDNARAADVADIIDFDASDFFLKPPATTGGIVIMNPPYGERLKEEELKYFYRSIGDRLKEAYKGYTVWILTTGAEALKNIGLHPNRKITLFNGGLECKFLRFEMYEGSKKESKRKA